MPGLPPLATIISIIQHRDIVSYFNIVASTAFIYDFCLTFGMEVDQIWSAQWTPLKVAYLLQRYLPFVDTVGISIYHGSAPGLTPAYCRSNYYATIFIDMISMIGLSELILTFRTWAVWRRDPKLGIALGIIFALFFGSTLTFGALFLRSMTFGVLPIPNFSGCLITGANNLLSGGWVLLMAYDLWMLILMAIPAVRSYRQGGHNHLLRVVYRDGIVYYIYLFGFSTANAVLNLALPKDLSFVLTPTERVMHSILASRVVLQLRSQANQDNVHVGTTAGTREPLSLGSTAASGTLPWKVAEGGGKSMGTVTVDTYTG